MNLILTEIESANNWFGNCLRAVARAGQAALLLGAAGLPLARAAACPLVSFERKMRDACARARRANSFVKALCFYYVFFFTIYDIICTFQESCFPIGLRFVFRSIVIWSSNYGFYICSHRAPLGFSNHKIQESRLFLYVSAEISVSIGVHQKLSY